MTYYIYGGNTLLGHEMWPVVHDGCFYRLLLIYSEEELKYSISNIAFAQGEVARVNDNYGHDLLGDKGEHYLHQWKDVCEDGNMDRVRDVLEESMSEVEHMLYKYSAVRLRDHLSIDGTARDRAEYVIELKIPHTFAENTCWYLMRLIKEYMTCRVLEDWASITLPEVQERWATKRQDAEDKIKDARSACGTIHRVTPTPI